MKPSLEQSCLGGTGAHLVVLGNNHVGILGKVEVQGRLVCSKIVDMEDQALIHTGPVAPNDPANSRVHQPVSETDKRTLQQWDNR